MGLTKLPEIKEGELGSLVVGDWIALISQPNDLSESSSKWWDAVLRATTEAYTLSGFVPKPLQRLYVVPRTPIEEDPSWGRVEQRGQSMALAALPEMLKAEVLAIGRLPLLRFFSASSPVINLVDLVNELWYKLLQQCSKAPCVSKRLRAQWQQCC